LAQLKKNITKAKKEVLAERREIALKFILKQNQHWMDTVKNNRVVYETDLYI